MSGSTTSALPIHTLREHVTALEAAIPLCLADPKEKTVHRLRTTTRRIEGQLAMLDLLPGVPKHARLAGEAARILKKLRRAAGEVRDIDVQLDLIQSSLPSRAPSRLRSDADKLRATLEHSRTAHAKKLRKVLQRRQPDLVLTLESLLDTLRPAEDLSLTSTGLTSFAQQWFHDNVPSPPKNSDDPDHLHTIRKIAKLARYIAENGPRQARKPRRLAESFEQLQQSGGEWHDWLVLADIAEDHLGASSPLTLKLRTRSRSALAAYHRHLKRMAV